MRQNFAPLVLLICAFRTPCGFAETHPNPEAKTPAAAHGQAGATLPTSAAGPAQSASTSELSAQDWSSLRSVYERGLLVFRPDGDAFAARAAAQAWTGRFYREGFTLTFEEPGSSWGLELERYGWGELQRSISTPGDLTAAGQRLERDWGHGLREWYINGRGGLEHGFTLDSRPPAAADSPLTLELSIRGPLLPRISPDGRDVDFKTSADLHVLDYDGLVVFDADGRSLDAGWSDAGEGRLELRVDDSGARYPLTIDPVVQQAYLKASNTNSGDRFGSAVAVSGDTVVVGALWEDSNATGVDGNQANDSQVSSGAVYVFVRSGSTWVQQAYLKASNTELEDMFGFSVAISGDTLVVGAPLEDSNATGVDGNQANNLAEFSGAVYVFVRNGSTWAQQAYLKASNTGANDRFGQEVAVDGDLLAVSSPLEDSNATGIGGNQADNGATDSGAVYIFARTGTTWTQQAYLKASNAEAGDGFGGRISLSGDSLAVGAGGEDSAAQGVGGNQASNGAVASGAAYVFVRNGTTWSQQAYLKASNAAAQDFFASSLALDGNTLAVGAAWEDSNAKGVGGDQSNNSANRSGAAYVFVRNGAVWTQQAYLKASNTEASDWFGLSIGLSGDRIVVGAPQEDSNAKGINDDGASNGLGGSGAAYVFSRVGNLWTQTAYVKASNTEGSDFFGQVLGLSGNLLVIGAYGEDSNATGIGGTQSNNAAPDSGACYLFDLASSLGLSAYGSGTPGCAGPQTLSTNLIPTIGLGGFALTCNNAPPLSAGFGVLATGQDLLGSDPFGLGVLFHVDPLSTALLTVPFSSDAQGNAVAPAPIPNNPALVGQTLYAQLLWSWSSCVLPPFGLSTSNGLALTFLAP